MKILLIEDDQNLATTLKRVLADYVIEIAQNGKDGEYLATFNCFDLIVLDLILPDKSGLEVCKKIREHKITTPILILSGKCEIGNKIIGFSNGADDYLLKPFHTEELLARVKALLRRSKITASQRIKAGDLALDLDSKTVFRKNNVILLRRKEYLIFEYLIRHRGTVVSRETLLDHVWGLDEETMGNVVDVHIKYLRDRIDKGFQKKHIKTVHGMGYKLEP